MEIRIIIFPIAKAEITEIAKNQFGDLVKAVVDIDKEIIAIGGELHADNEALLLQKGSRQQDLWGINIYPGKSGDELIEFDSMINIRPSQDNRSRSVESLEIQRKISDVVNKLIL